MLPKFNLAVLSVLLPMAQNLYSIPFIIVFYFLSGIKNLKENLVQKYLFICFVSGFINDSFVCVFSVNYDLYSGKLILSRRKMDFRNGGTQRWLRTEGFQIRFYFNFFSLFECKYLFHFSLFP